MAENIQQRTRVDNWPSVLADRIEHWRHVPLIYGESDCLQVCGDVVYHLTGVDYRDVFPKYSSKAGAEEILAAVGGLAALISSVLGQRKHPSKAMRGDVVVASVSEGYVAGICLGAVWAGPTEAGLAFLPMSTAIAAWSV